MIVELIADARAACALGEKGEPDLYESGEGRLAEILPVWTELARGEHRALFTWAGFFVP